MAFRIHPAGKVVVVNLDEDGYEGVQIKVRQPTWDEAKDIQEKGEKARETGDERPVWSICHLVVPEIRGLVTEEHSADEWIPITADFIERYYMVMIMIMPYATGKIGLSEEETGNSSGPQSEATEATAATPAPGAADKLPTG